MLLRAGDFRPIPAKLSMLNIESGNHLKEMSVNSHGSVKFGPERKAEFSFCSKQGKIFVSCVQGERRGTATTSAWLVSIKFGEMSDC